MSNATPDLDKEQEKAGTKEQRLCQDNGSGLLDT